MSYQQQSVPYATTLAVANGSAFSANTVAINGVAQSLIIDASQVNATGVTCQINGTAVFPINVIGSNGGTYSWNKGDMMISSIAFANSGGSSQTITIIAG